MTLPYSPWCMCSMASLILVMTDSTDGLLTAVCSLILCDLCTVMLHCYLTHVNVNN